MAYEIGTASGHYDLLDKLRTFLETTLPAAERWVVQRSDMVSANREVIWKAPGLSTNDPLYVGISTYQDVSTDYYNWKINGFSGYTSSNTFDTQPGAIASSGKSIALWNQSIPYWFVGNGQRCIVFVKINNANYMSLYLGKYFPYATPTQFPYPLAVGAMFNGQSATRYSVAMTSWFKNNLAIRYIDGNWRTPQLFPYSDSVTYRNTGATNAASTGYYGLHPITISENNTGYVNVYGELDGLYYISGFNNAPENTIVVGGVTYVVFKDNVATGLKDYVALKLA